MKRRQLLILISTLLLMACGLGKVLPSSLEPPGPTAINQAATLPGATSTPQLAPDPVLNWPALVWLPFAHSSESHDGKVLTIRSDQGAFEPAPVEIGMFWDYTPLTGRIVFASHFWQPAEDFSVSVSDLWVYDYVSGRTEKWWGDHIVRAAWSPVIDSNISKQYLAAALDDNSLALFTGPNEFRTLSSDSSSNFSWSPDGRWLAYLKNGGLFIIPVDGGEPRQLTEVVTQNAGGLGWIGDKPVWALEHQSIIYTKAPFEIARLDDSEVFIPRTADGNPPEGERAFNMLWSPEKRILVIETEELNAFRVWIYELSPDLKTITNSYSFDRIESEPLAAWWAPGESILLRNGDVWSIPEKAIILTIR